MVISLERDADLHMASWCHCRSLSLASVKSRLVLAYPGSPGKGPLNGCVWWMQTDGRAVNDAVVDDRRTMAIDLQCIELAVWDGWVRTWIELQTYASPSHRHRQCTHKSTNPIQRELMGAKNPLCLHLHTITTHISKSWRYIWTDKPK